MPSDPSTATRRVFDPAEVLSRLSSGRRRERLVHVHEVPARLERVAPWPDWVAPAVYSAFSTSGITQPWSHQREAADRAHDGSHVVISTGTASGKSLGYLLPVLSDVVDGAAAPSGRGTTALYLSPTKALAADQLARLTALAIPGLRAATYDGDTPPDERRWIRDHCQYVLTNPDLVHHSLLPGHERWAPGGRALWRRSHLHPRQRDCRRPGSAGQCPDRYAGPARHPRRVAARVYDLWPLGARSGARWR